MSTITIPSRVSKDVESKPPSDQAKPKPPDVKLETRLNIKDLEALQDAFMEEGEGYDNRLSLNREQFAEALSLILNKGSKEEYQELFDKVDVTKEGIVDWDKFASHMLLEFYEKDDRVKSTQVPQWKDLKVLPSPHKEVIQKLCYLKNTNRYIAISKEGCVSMWGQGLRLQRTLKTGTDSCRARDLWVTNYVPLHNVNKIALSFTSKEIAIYDLSTKLEFNCQYKVQGLEYSPLTLDYWSNPNNANEAILCWGDTGGCVNALCFSTAAIALFERPPAPAGEKQEPCLNVQLKDVARQKFKNTRYIRHDGHSEWVRQVIYSSHLECFISCATTWKNSLVIGWMEKHGGNNDQPMKFGAIAEKTVVRKSTLEISQGVNAFDYHEDLNLIATAGVNHHVCMWNPYVVSKPSGVLRGHMAAVIQVQFNKPRGQLISFSKDKVLRIWDVQLQVCMQRLAGMFPKGPEVFSTLYFDDRQNRLFITFNYQLTLLEMKLEVKDRIMTHDRPVVSAMYNSTYNQVVTLDQGGTLTMWMVDTGQKVKSFNKLHGDAEVTCLAQDVNETRLYTGSTDGTVKIWDFNGHCYHTLACGHESQPADVAAILVLKRSVLVVGWTKYITVFRNQSFKDFHVEPSDWKGGQEHTDDILTLAFAMPNTLATGAYDGEIIVWNNNSEQASRHLQHRARAKPARSRAFITSRENTSVSVRQGGGPGTQRSLLADTISAAGTGSHSGVARGGGGGGTQAVTPSVGGGGVEGEEGGFDSHAFSAERPQSKSRAFSRISLGSNDESNDYGFAISRMAFLKGRKPNTTGANLVSCGGNGWVRLWNTAASTLVGEFPAHTQVGSIIMAVDPESRYMVTGDVDGVFKTWDISNYCCQATDELVTAPPPMLAQFQPHQDMVTSLEICERNERMFVLSASSDCSVALWDLYGNHIGTFGQEEHWKIEPYAPKDEAEEEAEKAEEESDIEIESENSLHAEVELGSTWEPDERATSDPANFRINTWDSTILGKDYQELRVKKRERRQPGTIPQLPYLHWERTGDPPAGPYAALDTPALNECDTIEKPDILVNPGKYFITRSKSADKVTRLPHLAENATPALTTAFDEKSLFPRYILDYETKMKKFHADSLQETGKKAAGGLLKNVLGRGPEAPSAATDRRSNNSPGKRVPKPRNLKPLSVKSGSFKED